MGPCKSIGVVIQRRYAAPTLYTRQSSLFLPCGTMLPVFFYLQDTWRCDMRRMQSHGSRRVNQVNSSPPDHHQAHVLNHDFSDAFDDSPCNTWTHREDPIKIRRAKSTESVGPRRVIVGSWPTIMTVDRSSTNRTVRNFCAKIPYKYRCSSYVSLTPD